MKSKKTKMLRIAVCAISAVILMALPAFASTNIYIQYDGFPADSITVNGVTVNAIYRAGDLAYSQFTSFGEENYQYLCKAFVEKFYKQVYGTNITWTTGYWEPVADNGSFKRTYSPQTGDILVSNKGDKHTAIVKYVNGDVVTVVEQNARNGSYAIVGRTESASDKSIMYWHFTPGTGTNTAGENYSGWFESYGKYYYYKNGVMQKEWQYIDGYWYYFSPDSGAAYANVSFVYNGKRYTLGKDGRMVTGWYNDNGKYTYHDSSGARQTGWLNYNGRWYYLNPLNYGIMRTGWISTGGKCYYLDPTYGYMLTGWQNIDGNWYYFQDSGVRSQGWAKIGDYWYYFDPSKGMLKTGWVEQNGYRYYLDPSTGRMATGWLNNNGDWYYLHPTSGAALTLWQKINGYWYLFNRGDGSLRTGWSLWTDGNYYYCDPGTGRMVTGWKKIDGYWYYMDPETGARVTGTSKEINGKTYQFNESGICIG